MKTFYIDINEAIDDPTGVGAISLVAHPAVETDFIAFSKDEAPKNIQQYHFNECEHTLKGIAMLADTPIYRYNPEIGEHFIIFTRETIKKMMLKQSMLNIQNSVNLDHQPDRFVNCAFMVESYLIDREKGIAPVEFQDAKDGSWVVSLKILNPDLWNEITTTDHFNGFSIEGLFQYAAAAPERNAWDILIDEVISEIA